MFMADEQVYTINIRKGVLEKPRWERSKFASRFVRNFLKRHLKTDKIKLDGSVVEAVWARGATKPLNKIRIKVEKDDDIYIAKLFQVS